MGVLPDDALPELVHAVKLSHTSGVLPYDALRELAHAVQRSHTSGVR
eukprot:CAMPEP_0173389440 /NCGR_PEP_ID=MMETSP1356-20130122/11747_1 /TAXON_ID=77927 ORGANISM="Hemiselmis virescens, Strain PCC157" /NCGR_SAMPLE_ID=MMETSP1356 /ASSEMBLY_ACC=CAM_ASM_000847 /LENGTH=46 /DNA_ID= /DNA_START= /DNA_END= /DNA_ORIENTATION=